MEIEINYLAIALATLASLIIGAFWYSKIAFGERWMSLVGLTEEKAKPKMASATAGMLVLSLVMAYMLSHVTYMSIHTFGYGAQLAGITSGFMMWLGFVLPVVLGTGLFEQRSKYLLLINLGNWLVTLVVMGTIIGFFGF
ncbi:MAG: DUF1761 domain-containing protein [Patescibacteria group bacterium UBA2163]